jgi:hypothetical protein
VAYAVGSVVGGNGVVVMMNADGGAAELGKEIRRAVARVYGWPGFLLDPIRPVAADPSALEEIAGRYRRGPDEVVTFRRVGDHLEEVIAGGVTVGAPIPTFLVGRDSLGFTDFPGTAVVVRDAAGRVTGLRMPYGDRPIARLAPDSLLPGELLRAGRLDEAADAYRALGLGESQITYMAYELLKPPPRPAGGAPRRARAPHRGRGAVPALDRGARAVGRVPPAAGRHDAGAGQLPRRPRDRLHGRRGARGPAGARRAVTGAPGEAPRAPRRRAPA